MINLVQVEVNDVYDAVQVDMELVDMDLVLDIVLEDMDLELDMEIMLIGSNLFVLTSHSSQTKSI